MTKDVPIRPAATVLLVRDGADGLEVFMVVRHHAIDFASGALVFPGGKVEPEDHEIAADPDRSGRAGPSDQTERASQVAALRETFEECGVLLGRSRDDGQPLTGERCQALRADGGRAFGDMLAAERIELSLDALTPYAHWITPPIMAKRFDTRFYIASAPEDQLAAHDGFESVDSVWIHPARGLAAAKEGKYTLVLVTRLNLAMLGESADAASAISHARQRRIVTIEPLATKTETGYVIEIPPDAGYGGPRFAL
jgi:8-oxo-dGTP pyrophosphatase MutT (NUDIX family)